MNPTTQPDAQSQTLDKWRSVAWLPIPLLLAAIIAARMAGMRDSFESHTLLLILSFTFYTLLSLGTLLLVGRTFLVLGSPGLLLLECGVILWSLAGTVGDFVSHGNANINVTIFNTGILLSGLCHLAGSIFMQRPQIVLRAKSLWLGAGCAFTLGALWLVTHAALTGWLPVFFIPGEGGTSVRYFVLISAIAMFALSAGVLLSNRPARYLPFTSWYALALLILAVGLFGVMIQLSLGSVVNWLSRVAQWLGGVYLLFAAFASLRESRLPLFPQEKISHSAYYRDAIAMAVVLAATALRLVFLQALGTQAPFVTFYPAVILAALYGGLRAGLLATALSAILAHYFWIKPVGQFTIGQPAEWLGLVIFLLSGAMVSWVTDALHRARTRAASAEALALLAVEREAAAEALRKSEKQYRELFENMVEGFAYCKMIVENGKPLDFIYLATNQAFETQTGLKNVTGKRVTEVIPGIQDSSPELLDIYGRVSLTGKPERFEMFVDALKMWFSVSVYSSEKGFFVAIFDVITDRKRAEEALRQSERREHERAHELATLLDAVPTPVIIVHDPDSRHMTGNRAADNLLRQQHGSEVSLSAPSETRPRHFRALKDGRELKPDELPAQRSARGAHVRDFEFTLAFDDGTFRDVLGYGTPLLDDQGRPRGAVHVLVDITDRKKTEAEVIKLNEDMTTRNLELESVNKELESFIYSVSHDLRAPIRTMASFANFLIEDYADKLGDKGKNYLFRIQAGSAKMADLIEDLLKLSRISRLDIRRIETDLSSKASAVIADLRESDPVKNVKVEIQPGIRASVDPMLIEVVLSNILGNAWKFTSKIEKAQIEFGATEKEGKTVYFVKDNGAGFDPTYAEKMFWPFHRLHTEQEFEGTGIGLAIVERIIRRHSGHIWAEGKVGQGATIYFTLA